MASREEKKEKAKRKREAAEARRVRNRDNQSIAPATSPAFDVAVVPTKEASDHPLVALAKHPAWAWVVSALAAFFATVSPYLIRAGCLIVAAVSATYAFHRTKSLSKGSIGRTAGALGTATVLAVALFSAAAWTDPESKKTNEPPKTQNLEPSTLAEQPPLASLYMVVDLDNKTFLRAPNPIKGNIGINNSNPIVQARAFEYRAVLSLQVGGPSPRNESHVWDELQLKPWFSPRDLVFREERYHTEFTRPITKEEVPGIRNGALTLYAMAQVRFNDPNGHHTNTFCIWQEPVKDRVIDRNNENWTGLHLCQFKPPVGVKGASTTTLEQDRLELERKRLELEYQPSLNVVPVGERRERRLNVTNTGRTDLKYWGINFESDSAVKTQAGPSIIPPGEPGRLAVPIQDVVDEFVRHMRELREDEPKRMFRHFFVFVETLDNKKHTFKGRFLAELSGNREDAKISVANLGFVSGWITR